MNCLQCGKELTGKWQSKYCSRDCMWEYQRKERAEASEAKRRRVCETCGKEFIMHWQSAKANKGEVKEGRFCSRKCRGASIKASRKTFDLCKVYFPICEICGEVFTARNRRTRACSRECLLEYGRREYHRNADVICMKKREAYEPKQKEERICGMCGGIFASAHRTESYCSDECRKQAKAGRKDARKRARKNGVYYERVNPLKVFKRDGWRCQLCGKKLNPKHRGTIRDDAPELDHIIPWAQGGEHSYRNTQCTCRKCNIEKGARELGQLRLFG